MIIKSFVKSLLKAFHLHSKMKPDIAIITLPRAGSTLLAEVLNVDKESKLSSEPLGLNKGNIRILKKYFNSEDIKERYTDISNEQGKQFQRYFNDLSLGKTWNSFYWSDFFSKYHSFKTSRTIFKIHKLTYLFDDVLSKDETKFVYLLRHPISHSLSRIRNNWDTYSKQYSNANRIKENLTNEQLMLIDRIEEKGTSLEHFVLSWVLENYYYIKLCENKNDIFLVTFEELVCDPQRVIKALCKFSNVSFVKEMVDVVQKPSHGVVHSTKETKEQIKLGDNLMILKKWRDKITKKEELAAFEILRAFKIDVYKYGEDLPEKKYRVIK